jgi:hypothetical protein
MNKQELAIAKKIAEIEGVDVKFICGRLCEMHMDGNEHLPCAYYNPFDWSILGPLMVKHKVIPDFNFNSAVVVNYDTQLSFEVDAHDENEESMKQAILECIIKSQEA